MAKENIMSDDALIDPSLLNPQTLSVLPLRDVVVFPGMVMPLFVGRPKSLAAVEFALAERRGDILLFTQDNPENSLPGFEDLVPVGIKGTILQKIALPDGATKVLVEGKSRVTLSRYVGNSSEQVPDFGDCESFPEQQGGELKIMLKKLIKAFSEYAENHPKIPGEVIEDLKNTTNPGEVTDIIAAQMTLSLSVRHRLLVESEVKARLRYLLVELNEVPDTAELDQSIQTRVKQQMDRNQKEYYLNEKMKAIQKELHELNEHEDELAALQQQILDAGMSAEAEAKATAEVAKLKQMSPMSAEASVIRNYVDWLLKMPWQVSSEVRTDLSAAQTILERDHYGLADVKDRLLEHLAVQQRVGKSAGSIICFVGPPGVGKTSLGKSIAEATNREFVRVSLGGVRDEAEIRGHRRTYIGALPGRIIQTLAKAGTKNPIILLDEIDKLGQDFRGDPSSALLEVLDPAQNNQFTDHFIETPMDLSEVMFIATANSLQIPGPLLDRLEVVKLSGYTESEKIAIADRYLYPRQREKHGLKAKEITLKPEVISSLVQHYTREAGVRGLDRQLAKLCRKAVRLLSESNQKSITLNAKRVREWLGAAPYSIGVADKHAEVGRVTGLAWTQVGGELLNIEAAIYPGSGKLTVSGSLGEVMKESITAALTTVKANAASLNIPFSEFDQKDLHIHVPDGATPKDGPSAGVAMVTVIVSVFTGIPISPSVAMTGEVTLSGRVMKIGGLKEKLLAAKRGGIRTIIFPTDNQPETEDLGEEIIADIDLKSVEKIENLLKFALIASPYEKLEKSAGVSVKSMKRQSNFQEDLPVNNH